MKGYVYVLSNEAMPGLVKIGRSKHGGHSRGASMYKGDTGVPLPFQLVFECMFDNCIEAESMIHDECCDYRVNPNREFFRMDANQAIVAVLRMRACDFDHTVVEADLAIDESVFYHIADELDLTHVYEAASLLSEVRGADLARCVEVRRQRGIKFLAELEAKKCTSTIQ